MSKDNNNWWFINTILLIIILIILLSKCNKNSIYKGKVYNIDLSKNGECKLKQDDENIIIEDKNGDYVYQNNLNIFSNDYLDNKIAPGIFNIYYFKVKNVSNKDIKYYISFINNNDININLKYRLKRNGQYILGDKWLSVDELKTPYVNLKQRKSDIYFLEWKWFDNDNEDNYIGENVLNKYLLNINFYFDKM